jgi:hypothetical protein
LSAISHQPSTVRAHRTWLAVQIAAVMFGRRRIWGLRSRWAAAVGYRPSLPAPLSPPPSTLFLFLRSFLLAQPASHHTLLAAQPFSLSQHTHLAAYRPHAPYCCSLFTASCSFRCWRNRFIYQQLLTIETSILTRSLISAAQNTTKRWTKHTRLDNCDHGTIRPLTDHNDTHDEVFGYSSRSWHGHSPSLSAL